MARVSTGVFSQNKTIFHFIKNVLNLFPSLFSPHCKSASEEEKKRLKYCGIPPDQNAQTFSWLVALKFQALAILRYC